MTADRDASCSASILLPLESPWLMEPELSSTSATHNLVWPHTTVEVVLTGRVGNARQLHQHGGHGVGGGELDRTVAVIAAGGNGDGRRAIIGRCPRCNWR